MRPVRYPTKCIVVTLALLVLVALGVPSQGATQTGRVFPEPRDSSDFLSRQQFREGMAELERRYPRYLDFTTVRQEMNQPYAVSVGPDGVPAWDPEDTGDGRDFFVASLTDSTVPDQGKEYALFTVAHAAEWCGRESMPRFFEDLLILARTNPDARLRGFTGLDGVPLNMTVGEALRQTKLLFVDVAPDGWAAGDSSGADLGATSYREYDQYNGAGVNGNRVAYQDGWVFPDDPVIRGNGYSTMTQPEGIAVTQYLRQVREQQLGGRAFATSMDFHGPAPVGAMLFHEQGNDPAKLDRQHDLAERVTQATYDVLGQYASEEGAAAHRQLAGSAETAREAAFAVYNQVFGGVDEKALYLTLHWNEYATPWEHIDYTVSSSFGQWAVSDAGLDADGFSHEIPCQVLTGTWDPQSMQLYVDNVRAMAETMTVYSGYRDQRQEVRTYDLGGGVGFVDNGERVTDADGNPSPPPSGERTPLGGEVDQVGYNVANTDYFRDLRRVTRSPMVRLRPGDLDSLPGTARGGDQPPSRFQGLNTVVVADHTDADPAELAEFARNGGNVVLTDAALQLAPDVAGLAEGAVRKHYGYVGYADLDRDHPMTQGLYERAREMFDPVGLGYPLLMERDQYWPCQAGDCEESITHNSAPMWTIARAAWRDAGGTTVATADPPESRKGLYEGTETDKTILGTMPMGGGRLVVFGGILPQPTEAYPHWFGLNPYTVTIPGQQLLLRSMTWYRP